MSDDEFCLPNVPSQVKWRGRQFNRSKGSILLFVILILFSLCNIIAVFVWEITIWPPSSAMWISFIRFPFSNHSALNKTADVSETVLTALTMLLFAKYIYIYYSHCLLHYYSRSLVTVKINTAYYVDWCLTVFYLKCCRVHTCIFHKALTLAHLFLVSFARAKKKKKKTQNTKFTLFIAQ